MYEAEHGELQVHVPMDAKLDLLDKLLRWHSDKSSVRSTAKEVLDLAESKTSGFRTV